MESSDNQQSSLLQADEMVNGLRRMIAHGLADIENAKESLRLIMEKGLWKDRTIIMMGKRQQYDNWIRFVTDPPLEGLGTTTETLKVIAGDDTELRRMLDEAEQRPSGGVNNPYGCKGKPEDTINRNNVTIDCKRDYKAENDRRRAVGNTTESALRRLSKDRPDLLERVLAKGLSPHAAMIEAGFRKSVISIRTEPVQASRQILKHFDAEQVQELIHLLTDGLKE